MGRKVKCPICSLYDDKEKMIQEENKRYYHIESCHTQYQAMQKELAEEQEYKMKLAKFLEDLYGLESYKFIPNFYWIRLEQLRNEYTEANELGRTYKSGLPFKALYMAYDYCFNIIKITYDKEFDSFNGQLLYDLGIVRSNLVDCRNYYIEKNKQEKRIEAIVNEAAQYAVDLSKIKEKTNYKKTKDERDISRFLD
jgi:hypothetical protein